MDRISVIIPCYNEQEAIPIFYEAIQKAARDLPQAELELLFVNDGSKDNSLAEMKRLAERDPRVKYVSFSRNFGKEAAMYAGLSYASGDYTAIMDVDLQDPPEVIPQFIAKWEEGYQIVAGIKSKSRENKLLYFFRNIYYNLLAGISETEHIKQFDGFGLYDATFIKVLRRLEDPLPYLRGLVAELGGKRAEVEYTQERRKQGKTSFNFMRYYDFAMLGITSSTKAIMRMSTFLGGIMSIICLLISVVTLILKITNWEYYDVGTAAIIIGIFFVGAVQTFFLGFLGEYILNINIRVMGHPVVIEERRINLKYHDRDIID